MEVKEDNTQMLKRHWKKMKGVSSTSNTGKPKG